MVPLSRCRPGSPWPGLIAFAALGVCVFTLAFTPLRASHDEWWHLKTGRWIDEQGLPAASFRSDEPITIAVDYDVLRPVPSFRLLVTFEENAFVPSAAPVEAAPTPETPAAPDAEPATKPPETPVPTEQPAPSKPEEKS